MLMGVEKDNVKLRHRHIEVADFLKTAVRTHAVGYDADGKPSRFEDEVYAPAHVHIVERDNGRRTSVHNDDYPRLRTLLDAPAAEIERPSDPDEGRDSDAVYIKIDPRLLQDNVTYQAPISKAALARLESAITDGSLPVG